MNLKEAGSFAMKNNLLLLGKLIQFEGLQPHKKQPTSAAICLVAKEYRLESV